MRNILRSVIVVALLGCSCGPSPQTPTEVSRIGAAELVAHVRDHGDRAYRGHRVQVRVPPRSYTVEGSTVYYFTGLPGARPVINFACISPQDAGAEDVLIVSGVCRGAEYDGVRKGDRVTFVVYVAECHVTRFTAVGP